MSLVSDTSSEINDDSFHLAIVLLAAGASARMGRPKLLLPWGERSILGHLLSQWIRLRPTQVAVVFAAHDDALPGELDHLDARHVTRIPNPKPERGMFSSIQAAATSASWNPSLTHWLLSLGDQPLVRFATYQRLIAEAIANPSCICQPARHGRPRHPVVLPAHFFRELALADGESGNLKQFLNDRANARHLFETDDLGLDFDLDYPEDYEKARHLMTSS